MVVDWHTHYGSTTPPLQLREAHVGQQEWEVHPPESRAFAFGPHLLHRVRLTGLLPDTEYLFRWSEKGPIYRFRTMPNHLDRPVRIVFGGDTMHHREWMDAVNRVAAATDPDCIVWGGDLAYADGLEENLGLWVDWFSSVRTTLMTADRRVIPILVGLGNHENSRGYVWMWEGAEATDSWRSRMAPWFFGFFAFPGQPGYGVIDFGPYLSLVILDTGHANLLAGPQTDWLRKTLQARVSVKHVIPVYHAAAYPSWRPLEDPLASHVRETWVPLFEDYGVTLAFENHDHTYKRTFPIRGGRIDPTGIVYMGDGAWGVRTRTPRLPERSWYLARTAAVRHCTLLELEGDRVSIAVFDELGRQIDAYSLTENADAGKEAVRQVFPWSRLDPDGDCLWADPVFGRFYAGWFPWIHADKHGWLFPGGRDGEGVWVYDGSVGLGWLWTSPEVFPFLFDGGRGEWLFFEASSGGPGQTRWFYRFSSVAAWFPVEAH